MRFSKALIISAIILSACSEDSTQETIFEDSTQPTIFEDLTQATIFPETLNLTPLENAKVLSDCTINGMSIGKGNVTCVTIPFPEDLVSAEDRKSFANIHFRAYADAIINQGWTVTLDMPHYHNFERPVSGECPDWLQMANWHVNEKRKPKDRIFESSRITFIERKEFLCEKKRQQK